MKHKIDEIDKQILRILQENSKITNAKLSEKIGLSPAPTLERVKKLERAGLIKSYHAVLDTEKVGLGVTTFLKVYLSDHTKEVFDSFIEQISQIPNVIECHHVTGGCDFILKIITENIASYQKFVLESISRIKEIRNMETLVILSTLKDSKVMPIPD
ncbi:MAG: Lrp/AsnC family transcriptional regulator [Microscillaceae bacterium]|nr:Lrp/AsnC family transcriptional regulator [Microscillaceae bacterium]MDW8460075.1 Lrp/AsnC family transcriptional regulator [Cytophagales bacterium]